MRSVALAALLVLVAVGPGGAAGQSSSSSPPSAAQSASRVLIVGGDHNYPPYQYLENGSPMGFDTDMIRAVAAQVGLSVDIRLGPWHEVREALEQGRIDVVAGMAYSAEREKVFDFTAPYAELFFDVLVRGDSPIRTLEDALRSRVSVQEGGLMHDFLRQRGAPHILPVQDAQDVIKAVVNGEADCGFLNKYQMLYYTRKLDLRDVRDLNLDLMPQPYCFAVRQGDAELLAQLDEGLRRLKATDEYQRIYLKWFGAFEQQGLWHTARSLILILMAAGTVLVLVLCWTWTLRRQVQVKTAELQRLLDQHRQAELALQESEAKYRTLFEKSAIGIARIVYANQSMEVNAALERLLGYSQQELSKMSERDFTHPEDWEQEQKLIEKTLQGQQDTYQLEKRFVRKDGRILWTNFTCTLVRDPATRRPLYTIAMVEDITERRRAEERLRYDSLHDALTGLPNRTLFLDRLNQSIVRRKRSRERLFSVLFADLDEFKKINDSLGHQVGDELLLEIAGRIRDCLRPEDTVARFGGDEFAVLLESIETHDDTIQITERLLKSFSRPFQLSSYEVHVTASIGVVHCPDDPPDAQEILRDADTAMYQAKRRGKNRYVVFDRSMHEAVVFRLTLEEELRRALRQGEITLYYQPIMELATGRLVAFEALARWNHPSKGVLHPELFVPLAEETGLIITLGDQVVRESCRQLAAWRRRFEADLQMHVNLSVRQFMDPDLDGKLERVLEHFELDPAGLTLEITESIMPEYGPGTRQILNRLKQLGVKLCIDDFGTGYSSLSYLSRLPIELLKIDRLFVSHMTESEENLEIVRAVGALGRTFGLALVAEGVETEEHLRQLRTMNYQFAQGFYFAYPLEVHEVEQMLAGKNVPG
ncbi:MAG: hypothetical protein Kow0059_06250 [Candidatus Sumerlaeia bacterium]